MLKFSAKLKLVIISVSNRLPNVKYLIELANELMRPGTAAETCQLTFLPSQSGPNAGLAVLCLNQQWPRRQRRTLINQLMIGC